MCTLVNYIFRWRQHRRTYEWENCGIPYDAPLMAWMQMGSPVNTGLQSHMDCYLDYDFCLFGVCIGANILTCKPYLNNLSQANRSCSPIRNI